jgi:hypothetical protein
MRFDPTQKTSDHLDSLNQPAKAGIPPKYVAAFVHGTST